MKAVIFDLYETLVTEYHPGWQPRYFHTRLSLDEAVANRAWKARYTARMTGKIADFPTVLREMCEAGGVVADEQVIDEIYRERLALKAVPFANIEAPIIEMIRTLLDNGYKLSIISNATHEEVAAWPDCDLADLIPEPVFSFEVGCMKPDRAIYEIACDRVGCAPKEAIFIGDGGSNELTGAQEAGLTPVWATWFLERWPGWEQRRVDAEARRCRRMRRMEDVVEWMEDNTLT